MEIKEHSICDESRERLVNVAGRFTQDLGLGRLFGQVLVYLYLHPTERSLDDVCEDLQLSKAAASTTTRQLENFGLIARVWHRGDRRRYYRTADDLASALQNGLFTFLGQKVHIASNELDSVAAVLGQAVRSDPDAAFLVSRIARTQKLRDTVARLMRSPLLKLFR